MSNQPTLNKNFTSLSNAGMVELEKTVASLYSKRLIDKNDIKALINNLKELVNRLPESENWFLN